MPSPLLIGPELMVFATPIAGASAKVTGVASSAAALPLLVSGFVPLSEVSLAVPLGLLAEVVALLL